MELLNTVSKSWKSVFDSGNEKYYLGYDGNKWTTAGDLEISTEGDGY